MSISADTETAMLDRAAQMLSNGDVSSARLLFEHVAKKGSGKAALALARTFDPAFFGSINTRGLKPDPAKAKEWYAVAAGLGQDEARSRLGALSAR
jgi:TPR repeat protein